MVDHVSLREKSETVKQFEDGVARLVDGHDNHSVSFLAQSEGGGEGLTIKYFID